MTEIRQKWSKIGLQHCRVTASIFILTCSQMISSIILEHLNTFLTFLTFLSFGRPLQGPKSYCDLSNYS